MPDPGLPPPTQPAQMILDRWLHDAWAWFRSFVQSVKAADTSINVSTKNGVVSLSVPPSGAPTSAEYVLVATSAALPQSRVLTAGSGITITDGGAGSTITVASTGGLTSPLTTKGDIWGYSSSNARVPVGSDGQVLTADSTQTLGVKWGASGGGGDFVKISQVIVAGSPASNIAFNSIPNTYTDLEIVITGRDSSGAVTLSGVYMKINSDATAANYTAEQFMQGFSATVQAGTDAATTNGGLSGYMPGSSGLATALGVTRILIPLYSATVFQKAVFWSAFGRYSGPVNNVRDAGFVWLNTASITDIVLTPNSTFVVGTTATLYGRK